MSLVCSRAAPEELLYAQRNLSYTEFYLVPSFFDWSRHGLHALDPVGPIGGNQMVGVFGRVAARAAGARSPIVRDVYLG